MNTTSLDKDTIKVPYPEGARVKTIKSKVNNQYVTVLPQSVNDNTYAVYVNDKCLHVYEDKYNLKQCANTNNYLHPQYFEAKNIIQQNEKKNMGNKAAKGIYPYTAFVHKGTQQCLTYDNEGLYVANCNGDNIYQKWQVSPNENICLEH